MYAVAPYVRLRNLFQYYLTGDTSNPICKLKLGRLASYKFEKRTLCLFSFCLFFELAVAFNLLTLTFLLDDF